ncbi:TraB/GumN family protein [Solitalea sp. MAHUQ-68]|uniref:TraB/GumN family protein n=1 Tax=Solitalea agri TaxID=2953739 RepID=A0A9X2F5N6_9SPHI|nr:TraB/GumN family protein [Solitalea agri]MCO4294590.1 TraB/GumN family protein [Solitalea agri]
MSNLKSLLLSCFLLLTFAAQGFSQQAKSLLWKISGNGITEPSYLYGTIHIICEKDFLLSNPVEESFKKTSQIYLEIDMDDPNMMADMQRYMNMPNDQNLQSVLKPEDYRTVGSFFKDSLGVNIDLFKNTKPLLLYSFVLIKMMDGCSTKSYEQTFVEMAKAQKKEVKGLETIPQQMSFIDQIPLDKQAEDLVKSINSYAKYKEYFNKMIAAYKNQDIEGLQKLSDDPEFGTSENENEALIYSRNKNWIELIKNIAAKQSTFFAVGAGHLAGESGVINLLRKQGYTVEAVN